MVFLQRGDNVAADLQRIVEYIRDRIVFFFCIADPY